MRILYISHGLFYTPIYPTLALEQRVYPSVLVTCRLIPFASDDTLCEFLKKKKNIHMNINKSYSPTMYVHGRKIFFLQFLLKQSW